MDTGTTVGALFGSRTLYDNLNMQLHRLNDITLAGKSALFKTSSLLDTLHSDIPGLLHKVDGITDNVSGMMNELKPLPGKVDQLMGNVEGLMGDVGNISDFMESTEQTLQNADDLMTGISNMWIIRRNMPSKDSVPFMVETLW